MAASDAGAAGDDFDVSTAVRLSRLVACAAERNWVALKAAINDTNINFHDENLWQNESYMKLIESAVGDVLEHADANTIRGLRDSLLSNADKHGVYFSMLTDFKRSKEVLDVFLSILDVQSTVIDGISLLHYAVHFYPEAVPNILEFGGDPNCYSGGEYPINTAAQYHFEETVTDLVKAGAKCDIVNDDGMTPLMMFANMVPVSDPTSNLHLVEVLIENGCPINARSECNRRTALHFSAYLNFLPCVKLLIKLGADVNVQDSSGDTALISAAREGHGEVVQLLLASGVNPDIKNSEHKSALMIAICAFKPWHHSPYDIIIQLIKANADVNVKAKNCLWPDPDPHLPLEVAIKINLPDVARILIEADCCLDVVSDWLESDTHPRFIPSLLRKDKDLVDILKHYVNIPLSLSDFCRRKIRKSLGNQVAMNVAKLPLPELLIDYLSFEELDDLGKVLFKKYHSGGDKYTRQSRQ